MAEVLVELMKTVFDDETGDAFGSLACGEPTPEGTWHGWIEFVAADGKRLRSPRETTQPNRENTVYWATGLSPVYLEGAFARAKAYERDRIADQAIEAATRATASARRQSTGPAQLSTAEDVALPTRVEAVLDPFSVHQKGGDALLRRQLAALSSWHLVNIIVAYGLSNRHEAVLSAVPGSALIDIIIEGVDRGR
jgi:hypothetical protein